MLATVLDGSQLDAAKSWHPTLKIAMWIYIYIYIVGRRYDYFDEVL